MNVSFFLERVLEDRRSHWVLVVLETGTLLKARSSHVVKTHKAANIL